MLRRCPRLRLEAAVIADRDPAWSTDTWDVEVRPADTALCCGNHALLLLVNARAGIVEIFDRSVAALAATLHRYEFLLRCTPRP